MKFLKYIIIALACILMFASCDSTPADDTQSSDPAVSQKSTEPITSDTETEPPIGGSVGLPYEEYYNPRVCGIIFIPDTCMEYSDELNNAFSTYEALYKDKYSTGEYPPLVLYYIQELNINREDFEEYNIKLLENPLSLEHHCSEDIIDALYSTDENEQKRGLKSEYAVYSDGKIYNFYDLEKLTEEELTGLDLTEQEWADYIAKIETVMENMIPEHQKSLEFLRPLAGDATPTTTAPETTSPETTAELDTSI